MTHLKGFILVKININQDILLPCLLNYYIIGFYYIVDQVKYKYYIFRNLLHYWVLHNRLNVNSAH